MANTEEKTTEESSTISQETVDYAFMDGELSEQEHEDITQINYLTGGK